MWNAVTQKMRDLLFVALNSIKLTWQCSKIIIFHRKNTSNQWPSDHAGTMTHTSFTDIGPIESCPCPGSIDSLEMRGDFWEQVYRQVVDGKKRPKLNLKHYHFASFLRLWRCNILMLDTNLWGRSHPICVVRYRCTYTTVAPWLCSRPLKGESEHTLPTCMETLPKT